MTWITASLIVIVLWGVVALTVISGAAYFWRFWKDVMRPAPRPVPVTDSPRPAVEARAK